MKRQSFEEKEIRDLSYLKRFITLINKNNNTTCKFNLGGKNNG